MPDNKVQDQKYNIFTVPLNGKWKPALDPIDLQDGDFSQIKNFRYKDGGIAPVKGETKINTTALSSYPKTRNGWQFKNDAFSESNVYVQSFNSGGTASNLYSLTTTPPTAGDFSGTDIRADASGAGIAQATQSPNSCFTYCNGKETLATGGANMKLARFIDSDSLGSSYKYDYTTQVTNSSTSEYATVHRYANTVDSSTKALWHFDGSLLDSSGNSHTLTAAGNATTSATKFKFGTRAGYVDGTGDYFSATNHADFNLSGGLGAVDTWIMNGNGTTGIPTGTLFSRYVDASNYIRLYRSGTSLILKVVNTATEITLTGDISWVSGQTGSAFTHVEVDFYKSGSDYYYYMFVGGTLIAYDTSTTGPPALTGADFYIATNWTGSAGDTLGTAYIDEFRYSVGAVRHRSAFTPPTLAYGSGNITDFYVCTQIAAKGFKIFVVDSYGNTTAGTLTAYYWDGATYTETAVTDGTATAGVPLAKTGSNSGRVVFTTDSSGYVKPRSFDGTYGFWYKLSITECDTTVRIYQVTVSTGVNPLEDIWDGIPRDNIGFYKYDGSKYTDYTLNLTQVYLSSETSTYFQATGLTTAQSLVVGFSERLSGLNIQFADGKVVDTASCFAVISYCNGLSTEATKWSSVGTLSDGTIGSNCSFSKSGTITWTPPNETTEFTQTIGNDVPLYYYRITFTTTIGTADVRIIRITGITAQKTIRGFSFPVRWQDRLGLGCEQDGARNKLRLSAQGTTVVFNGSDSVDLTFGDDQPITIGGGIFNRFGSGLVDSLIICKTTETWLVDGDTPSNWKKYCVSKSAGCPSPSTFKICDIGLEIAPGINRHVAIWHTGTGVAMFDQSTIIDISGDIANYWQDWRTEYINTSIIDKFSAWYDERYKEYHLLIATGANTSLDTELVYDLTRRKWFKIYRGTKGLSCGFQVSDFYGNRYTYGGSESGYVYRLEYGNTFDGDAIDFQFRPGDKIFVGPMHLSDIYKIKLLAKSKNTTTNKVTFTHYGDTSTVASTPTVPTFSLADSTHRISMNNHGVTGVLWGPYTVHTIDVSISTTNENPGFEPIALAGFFKIRRLDFGG